MADLRTFLETAKRYAPEAYLEIKEKHDINLEVCALVGKLEKQRRIPLLLFSNIDNLIRAKSSLESEEVSWLSAPSPFGKGPIAWIAAARA